MSSVISKQVAVAEGLRSLLQHCLPGLRDLDIGGLKRASAGLSRENWAFDAKWTDASGPQARELMLMRDAAAALLATDRTQEVAILKALEQTPVPAPAVLCSDVEGQWLGSPSIVVERVRGVCDYMVLNGKLPVGERRMLAEKFLQLMAEIHAVDLRRMALGAVLGVPDEKNGGKPSLRELTHWEAELRRVQLEPVPEMDYVLTWLRAHAPEAEAVVLVHGDFKPGNALVADGEITAKLDWEIAHLGDPLEDLGWITNPVRKREHQIPGVWERAQILEAYRARTGRVAAEAHVTWWNILACFKLVVIQLTGLREFIEGRSDRIYQTPAWLYRPMFQMMEAS